MLEVPGAGSHRKCGSTSPPLARARRAAGSDGRQGGTRTCSSSCRRCLRLRRQFLIKTYTSQRLRRYHRHGHNARSGARSISIAERATFGTRSRTRSRDVGLVDGVGRKALPAQPNRHIKEVSKLSAHSQPHCPPPGGMGAQRGRTQDPVMPVPSSLPQSPSSFSPLEDGDHREEHGGCPFGTFFAFFFLRAVTSGWGDGSSHSARGGLHRECGGHSATTPHFSTDIDPGHHGCKRARRKALSQAENKRQDRLLATQQSGG
jgi:hypothetical protein